MWQPRIFVGTLYSGENELDQCIQSLKEQSYSNWEHKIFSYLPNKEAHDTLYREFMNRQDEFELFIKLDADMVFIDNESLNKIIGLFEKYSNLDHAVIAVHDWFSDSLIMGLHIFTNRVWWEGSQEQLFVDYNPSMLGERHLFWKEPAPIVVHSPNPHEFQAFHFGVHRALKAFQPNRKSFNRGQANNQWLTLKRVWSNFKYKKDYRLGLVTLGAHLVLKNEVSNIEHDYTNSTLRKIFDEYSNMKLDDLYKYLAPYWDKAIIREKYRLLKIFPKLFSYLVKRFFKKFLLYILYKCSC